MSKTGITTQKCFAERFGQDYELDRYAKRRLLHAALELDKHEQKAHTESIQRLKAELASFDDL